MSAHSNPRPLSRTEIYGLWSEVYDQQPNPMLTLECRIVESLLPNLQGKDVLDLGCGTGRWLASLAQHPLKSLTGIDISPEMLTQAAHKLGTRARLFQGTCLSHSLPSCSADLVLSSFVVSHIPDPRAFAVQIARLLRPNGTIFLSDLHPDTVRTLKWNRSFRTDSGVVPLDTEDWDIDYLIELFSTFGLEVVTRVEPRFASPELQMIRQAGRSSVTQTAFELPAIYVLQLRRKADGIGRLKVPHSGRVRSIYGAALALSAEDSPYSNLTIEHAHVGAITTRTERLHGTESIDLTGYRLLPGLINTHDHLDFALFPRLGHRTYRNFVEWSQEIHRVDADTIKRHRAIPKDVRLWWGAIRNLLSGVTTVCHHNPLTGDLMAEDFPVRVIRHFNWAHSVTFDHTFASRHRRTPVDQPFIIHSGEGMDDLSRNELATLASSGALDDRTVIVHGLACDASQIRGINHRNSSLIWCPSSNVFLFGNTHTADTIRNFNQVAIGNDSPLTAAGDLLDEIRFARDHTGIEAGSLYSFATTSAAQVLKLPKSAGRINFGAVADLIAVPASTLSPSDQLTSLTYKDVHLVLRGGRVQLASPEVLPRIPTSLSRGLRPLEIDGLVRWVRAPLGRLFASAERVLGCDLTMNGRRLRNVIADWL